MSRRSYAVSFAIVAAACSSAPASGPARDMAAAPACTDAKPAPGTVCISTVSGRVVDEAGAPVSQLTVSVCAGACFFGLTDKNGDFVTEVKTHLTLSQFALLLHGGPTRASYYSPLPAPVGDAIRYPKPLVLYALPPDGPSFAMDASAQTLVSGDVTLTVAAGTDLQFSPEDFLDPPDAGVGVGTRFRARRVADAAALPFVDGASAPAALYALGPFELGFSRPARLSIVNSAGLPAGAAVDLLLQRVLVGGDPPAGPLATVATAHVTGDGKRIDMDDGQGIKSLSWLALRRRN